MNAATEDSEDSLPLFQVMPSLSVEEFESLKGDIAQHGVQSPVEYDQDKNIIDGHHRVLACKELGISDWPKVQRSYESDAQRRARARQLNLARRHLNRAQKRNLVADQLRETPEKSNRQIAEGLGVDDKTVSAVRRELEATAEIPQLDKSLGRDGKTRSLRKRSSLRLCTRDDKKRREVGRGILQTAQSDDPIAAIVPGATVAEMAAEPPTAFSIVGDDLPDLPERLRRYEVTNEEASAIQDILVKLASLSPTGRAEFERRYRNRGQQ
jgi:ParB-like chromosome segregation protein Spo0J